MPSKSPAAMLRGLADRARDPRQHPTWDSVSLKPDTVRLIAEVLEAAEDTKEDAAPYACGDSKWCDSADQLDTALSKLTAALESK